MRKPKQPDYDIDEVRAWARGIVAPHEPAFPMLVQLRCAAIVACKPMRVAVRQSAIELRSRPWDARVSQVGRVMTIDYARDRSEIVAEQMAAIDPNQRMAQKFHSLGGHLELCRDGENDKMPGLCHHGQRPGIDCGACIVRKDVSTWNEFDD